MKRRDRGWHQAALQVFISYRRSESGPYARNIYDALTHYFGEGSVFLDIDSIAPGRDFVDVLGETLDQADVLLVVMGPRWADITDESGKRRIDDPDDYVRLEVETALRSDDVRVIPVLVGAGVMPSASALPESLAALTRRNATSLVDEHWRSTMDELLAVLDRIRGEVGTQSSATPGPRHRVPIDDDSRARDPGPPHDTGSANVGSTTAPPPVAPASAEVDRSNPPRRNRAIFAGVVALVVVFIGVGAVVMSSGGPDSSSGQHTTSTSSQTTAPSTSLPPAGAPTYKVGDCLTANASGSTPAVSCDDPHTHEITNVTTYPAGPSAPWPSADQFLAIGNHICDQAFAAYVGVPPNQSQYQSVVIVPTSEEWGNGERQIYCAAISAESAVTTGSVRGSAK
jgi:hypothetical protein